MAKLVAATCPKCGAGVRLDPDKEFVTCTYCGVSSFIQTPRRPPTQQIEQQHVPVIRVERTRSSGCLPVALVAGIAMLGGSVAAVVLFSNVNRIAGGALGAASGIPKISIPGVPSFSIPNPVVAAEEDLFKDPLIIKSRLEERLGKPVRLKELVLYPSYAAIEAQDPKNKEHLDRYFYRAGSFQDPEPLRLSGSDRKSLEAALFSLDELSLDKLPALMADALAQLKLEDGKVSHVIIDRDFFGGKTPGFRVYASSERDSGGYVSYDASGKRRRVMK